jgi:hypothetical protein
VRQALILSVGAYSGQAAHKTHQRQALTVFGVSRVRYGFRTIVMGRKHAVLRDDFLYNSL